MNKYITKYIKFGLSTAVLSSYLLLSNENLIDSQFSPITVEAATVATYTTTANLNLRSTNSTKGKILLTIPKGKKVTYIKKSGNWYQVKYNGKTGWVSASYIKVTKTTSGTNKTVNSSSKSTTIYKTTANLNMRSTNSTKGKVLLVIPKGKQVTYIKKSGNWYQVKYNGKTGWVSASYITKQTKTTARQPKSSSSSSSNTSTTEPNESTIKLPAGTSISSMVVYTTNDLNYRQSNSASSTSFGVIPANTKLTTNYKANNGWYKVTYKGKTGFVSGNYLINQSTKDRITSLEANKNSYLFIDLRKPSSVTAEEIDAYINKNVGSNRSVLKNTGKYFVAAGKKYGVNALYLAAHAIHESNFGRSTISLDRYNLFGYGAYDLVPYLGSVKFASIEQNINFIAQKIKATYLGDSYLNQGTFLGYSVKSITGVRVDSLSKGMNFYYATDTAWGEKIAKHMNNILSYSKENGKTQKSNTTYFANPSYPSGSDVFPTATLAVAKSQITLYTAKSTDKSAGVAIKKGNQFNLLEKDNNYWLKVKYNGKTYYAKVAFNEYNKYFTVKNLGRVSVNGGQLNIRAKSNANSSTKILGTLNHKEYVTLVLDKNQKPIKENNFYKIKTTKNIEGWASSSYVVQELNK